MAHAASLREGEPGGGTGAMLHFAETRDVDEQAALLRGWNQSYAQMSSGAFSGSISEARFAGIHLFLETTNSWLYQTGELPRGACAVGVPLRSTERATFCGAPCTRSAVHVFSGRDGFEFHSPGGLIMAGIVLSEDVLAEALSDGERAAVLPSLRLPHLRRVEAVRADALRLLLDSVFEVLRGAPDLAGNSALVESLKRTLVSNLTRVLMDDCLAEEPLIAPGKRWQVVAAARDKIVKSPDRPVSVAELCSALGLSRRALQYCFQDVLGFGPAEFLRKVRLNGARRAIKTSRSVTEAATLWGFWHFGRFAHDYKLMFGELPSDTFRRFRQA